jgi:hypothetical protein
MKKEATKCVDNPLKKNSWIFEKLKWEHYVSKNSFNF